MRDGKTLTRIEVVLLRYKDVLRRKSRQARPEPRHVEEQLPAHLGGVSREASQVAEQPDAKTELVEDSNSNLPNTDVQRHNPGPAEVAQALQEMRNPEVKVKKELLLSDEYLLDALTWEGINHRFPIPVPPDIAEHPLPRAYISHLYGGGLQETFVHPREELVQWHGLRHWAFWTLDWNPHAPTRPGYSGLLFSVGKARDDSDTRPVRRTFVRVAPGKWVYMGQYKMGPGKSLTADTWRQQTDLVRRTWAKEILTRNWGLENDEMLARIWLRKHRGPNYDPSKEDIEAAISDLKNIRASLTEDDVNGVFDRGEHEMGAYTMTCVGYDGDFVRFLERNVHKWYPPALKKNHGVAPEPAQKKNGRKMGSKRKPIEVDSDHEQSDGRSEELPALEGHDLKHKVKVPASSVQLPERRSIRERVKRVRTS
ncbi:hypothetical protein C8T65DRAFT_641122 [Cerioporus squamosus]|nr:hypothetical protein C8T65DRAFT_641122 [Cerioporus squamosus]